MSSRGESIEPDEVAPGDLIFFNTTGRAHSHVGIYVGKLRFVNAPSTGGTVRLDYLTNPYWAKRFDGIRRVATPKAVPTPFDSPTYLASPVPADGTSSRASQTQVVAVGSRTTNASDQFEPPPVLSAARQQAQSAGAVSPVAASAKPGFDPFEPPPPALSTAQRQAQAANATSPAHQPQPESSAIVAASNSPDLIAAAADAFEPPPPTARLAAQQVRAVQEQQPSSVARIPASDQAVHVMRASTNPRAPTRPAPSDDPIAKFANGSY
jgi:hypothetical protein